MERIGEAESLAEVGAGHLRRDEPEKGVALLRRALSRDPHYAAALLNLGIALGDQGHAGEALEMLERLVVTASDYPGGWVALGVARARDNQWKGAIAAFDEAVQRDPRDGLARKNLGAALSKRGKLEEGLLHLTRISHA